jgi:hypothetical protein
VPVCPYVIIVPLYPEITLSIIFLEVISNISNCDEFSGNILSKMNFLDFKFRSTIKILIFFCITLNGIIFCID